MITLPEGLGSAQDIKKRFSVASERRQLWRSILMDMYDLCIPNRETFNFHSPGQRKARHIFDSTAPESLQTFVSVITSSLTPDNAEWMKYEAGTDIPEKEKKGVNTKLEDATKTFFKHLSHSEFSSQVNISHQDMAISTGAMLIEEGDDITEPLLKFTAIPLSELYIEPTSMARVHTFFRKHCIKAQEIELKFPDAEISDKLRKLITDGPTSDVEIIDGSQVFNFKTQTYHQVVIWEDEIIFHQDYGDSPVGVVYRFSKIAGETYGRGPADMAMADIRTVNKVKEYLLKNAALTLSPPLLGASDGVFNPHSARVHPGAVMAVSDTTSPPLIPLQVGGDLRIGQFVIEDLQNSIRKTFFADPLGDITDPVRSATENLIRQQEMLKKRGANFGRLQSEFLFPLVRRCTDILARNGKIPAIKVDGREVTLKMSSPLSQVQNNEDVDNLFVYLNAVQQLPENVALLGASLESVPQFLQQKLGLPENLARTPEQIEQAQQQLMEIAQQQEQPLG
jgi:hypothetical protein